ncbi:hypothetical protein P7D22_16035 [Lichenihabitans sp. Uapishka_5]|uniref:hypothetical protein n=1 Tax=Lichenihabitans sp. Uapishka_5 TaxID=3037302 RepID=UPI0029E7EA6B|nr:hypothetical protein [Lichenihabitans sp. Uapishka_5]MDX7952679.1 hypothetical protein [Lichenihabitans sp. Uapishka_5]
MTALLDRALLSVRSLPPEAQDDVARVLLELVGEAQALVDLTPDEQAALDVSEAAAARGDFASDAEIKAIWAKHSL